MKNFFKFLRGRKDFQEYTKISKGSNSQSFFSGLYALKEECQQEQFDTACLECIKVLFRCYCESLFAGRNSVKRSYHTSLLNYLQGQEFDGVILRAPNGLRDRKAWGMVLLILSRCMLGWVDVAIQQMRLEKNPQLSIEETNDNDNYEQVKEVNRFFGWAIASLRRNKIKKAKQSFRTHGRTPLKCPI